MKSSITVFRAMKGDPRNPDDWMRIAVLDYERVLRAMVDDDSGAAVLWLEQAAEKALKGWLIGKGWNLIKTHDLERLANECGVLGCDLTSFLPTGRRLKVLYFSDRYVDESPDAEPDAAEIETLRGEVEKLLQLLFPHIKIPL
jgi:HEPN domain-containing protein